MCRSWPSLWITVPDVPTFSARQSVRLCLRSVPDVPSLPPASVPERLFFPFMRSLEPSEPGQIRTNALCVPREEFLRTGCGDRGRALLRRIFGTLGMPPAALSSACRIAGRVPRRGSAGGSGRGVRPPQSARPGGCRESCSQPCRALVGHGGGGCKRGGTPSRPVFRAPSFVPRLSRPVFRVQSSAQPSDWGRKAGMSSSRPTPSPNWRRIRTIGLSSLPSRLSL